MAWRAKADRNLLTGGQHTSPNNMPFGKRRKEVHHGRMTYRLDVATLLIILRILLELSRAELNKPDL